MDEDLYRKEPAPAAATAQNNNDADKADYAKARPIGFDLKPITPQFHSLTEEVVVLLSGWEAGAKPRAYRRGKKATQFRRSVGLVLADLAMAADRHRLRWSYRSLTAGSFKDQPVSYRYFRRILDGLRN